MPFVRQSKESVMMGIVNCLRKKAFTLIELLVVMAVLAILIAASIPAYHKFKERAAIMVTKNTCQQIEVAVRAYEGEYKKWPTTGGGDGTEEMKGVFLSMLRGDDVGAGNKRKIVFFESEGTSLTPPGPANEKQPYSVKMDVGYNNKVTYDGKDIFRPVIVWADFRRKEGGPVITTVKSWE